MAEEKIITVRGVDYIVSSDGRIYSTNNAGASWYHKEILQRQNDDGYMQITVGKDGNRSQYRVHRMVAEAFIPNPDNLPEVNHKDCNRANNCVTNLEWCTHKYNIQHSIDHGNHFSTKNLTGSNNPNYDNHILAEKYKNDPALALEKQSRPGAQNGRARKIILIDTHDNKMVVFDCIKLAAEYLIKNCLTKAKHVDSLSSRLSTCATNKTKYKNRFCVEFID